MRPMPAVPGVRHRWVDLGGLSLHLAEAGDPAAPPLVCLHGWPECWYLWKRVMPAMADRFHVLAPDLRGFGWSDAPPSGYDKEQLATDVLALLDRVGVGDFALMGHDWGGWTGFLLAVREPARVKRFLALNIASPLGGPPLRKTLPHLGRLTYQLVIGAPLLGEQLLQRAPGALQAMLTRERGRRAPWDAHDLDLYTGLLTEPARAHASSLLYRTFLVEEMGPVLRGRYRGQQLAMPVKLLFGKLDGAIHPDLLDGFERQGPDVELELVDDVGHFIVDEAPELVIARARAFFGAPA